MNMCVPVVSLFYNHCITPEVSRQITYRTSGVLTWSVRPKYIHACAGAAYNYVARLHDFVARFLVKCMCLSGKLSNQNTCIISHSSMFCLTVGHVLWYSCVLAGYQHRMIRQFTN